MLLSPGYIVCERSINNFKCHGLRWMDFRDRLSPAFSSLIDTILPNDPKLIKPNNSPSFLVKIAAAMKSGTACASLSIKTEVAMKQQKKYKIEERIKGTHRRHWAWFQFIEGTHRMIF